jgi:hypothetical protein
MCAVVQMAAAGVGGVPGMGPAGAVPVPGPLGVFPWPVLGPVPMAQPNPPSSTGQLQQGEALNKGSAASACIAAKHGDAVWVLQPHQ